MTQFNAPNPSLYTSLMARRSVKARDMQGRGPDRETVEKILAAAMRVPDHGKLAPWRFIVLEGSNRSQMGALIKDALQADGASEAVADKMKNYAEQGPTLILTVYSPTLNHPIPEWEQALSMGAANMALLMAANGLGVAANWLTGWACGSAHVAEGLKLAAHEKLVGLIFLGDYPDEQPEERERPSLAEKVIWGMPQ